MLEYIGTTGIKFVKLLYSHCLNVGKIAKEWNYPNI